MESLYHLSNFIQSFSFYLKKTSLFYSRMIPQQSCVMELAELKNSPELLDLTSESAIGLTSCCWISVGRFWLGLKCFNLGLSIEVHKKEHPSQDFSFNL